MSGKLDGDEALRWVQIVLARVVQHTNVALFRSGRIG
jgi:hypothetical protein